jgi:pimeloyl-ACP methyl ester carboxylesterase
MSDSEFQHHKLCVNGLAYHVVTLGTGPAVLLCHGFPDLWRTWRSQMRALAAAGYQAIAPDMRGFGESEGPAEPTSYTSLDLVGDMVAILDHFEIGDAVIVGHDWGATIAWTAALVRPERFRAVAGLSVPYAPRGSASLPTMLRAGAPPDLYMLYLLPDFVIPSMRTSADGSLIEGLEQPPGGMHWFDAAEIDIYAQNFNRTGFTPALNTYRSLDRSWQLMAAWSDRKLEVPALYIGGDRDIVLNFPGMREAVDAFQTLAPHARPANIIANAGHWVHLEQCDAVNVALLRFLDELQVTE